MKIAYLVPGSGGAFYCENCMRDMSLLKAYQDQGHEIVMVPLYLPLVPGKWENPIFFGAVKVYLKEKFPLLRKLPEGVLDFLDAPFFLNMASRMASSTRASGAERLTVTMLQGEQGHLKRDLRRLTRWLKEEVRPEVVHLSNALLAGLAGGIKRELQVPVFCSLQDEDQWIDNLGEEYSLLVWNLIEKSAGDVDRFIAVSASYMEVLRQRIPLVVEKAEVIPPGIDFTGYSRASAFPSFPVVGYLSRLTGFLGLGRLVLAFIELKKDEPLKDLKLRLTGGMTKDDRKYLARLVSRLRAAGMEQDVEIYSDFSREERIKFLRNLSVLSVPADGHVAFGSFQLEALACGVPVVQPGTGAFREFQENTGGALLYDDNDPDGLVQTLRTLLLDRDMAVRIGQRGREKVNQIYRIETMVVRTVALYKRYLKRGR